MPRAKDAKDAKIKDKDLKFFPNLASFALFAGDILN
jgi:hypothetical protein